MTNKKKSKKRVTKKLKFTAPKAPWWHYDLGLMRV